MTGISGFGLFKELHDNKMGFFLTYPCGSNPEYVLIIEDDSKVAYAYLLYKNEVVSDVWLYNCLDNPDSVDWANSNEMPFLNPKAYTIDLPRKPQADGSIVVKWTGEKNTGLCKVLVFFEEILIAVLISGIIPGWCSNARKSGPLALALEEGQQYL